jgi:hypothetical protein
LLLLLLVVVVLVVVVVVVAVLLLLLPPLLLPATPLLTSFLPLVSSLVTVPRLDPRLADDVLPGLTLLLPRLTTLCRHRYSHCAAVAAILPSRGQQRRTAQDGDTR